MEGRRGTTDDFATTPFHLVLFSTALVKLFRSLRTEYLSSSPLLSSLPSESSCLLPCILLLLRLHTALFQNSLLTTEVKNISGDPRLFPATFLPKYLTGCTSHCCIVAGDHVDVHVLIPHIDEWCEFPLFFA